MQGIQGIQGFIGPSGPAGTQNAHAAINAVSVATGSGTSTYFAGSADAENGTGVGAYIEANANGTVPTIDGVTLSIGSRILFTGRTNQIENGIYSVTNLGSSTTKYRFTRATDYDNSTPLEVEAGDYVYVLTGTAYAGTTWVQIKAGSNPDGSIRLGTDLIYFSQAGGTGAQGLQGIQGLQGTSVQGIQGLAGSVQGLQGIQGVQGTSVQGSTGSAGTTAIQPIQSINSSTYTLQSGDIGYLMNVTAASTITVPKDVFVLGAQIDFLATVSGANQVSIVAASGVTLNGTPGTKLRTQYSGASLKQISSNNWVIFGDLSL